MVTTRSQAKRMKKATSQRKVSGGYYYVGRKISQNDLESRDAAYFLKQLWQLPRNTNHIPVPNPVSMLRRDISKLHEQPYFVSAKLDGIRFLLLIGMTETGHQPYSYMIDRAYHMYKVHTSVSKGNDMDKYTMGTLIDGELVQDRAGRLHFVGFDVVAVYGEDCTSWRYEIRLQKLRDIMESLDIEQCSSCTAKHCVPVMEIETMWENMNNSIYPSDGLIFMPDRCAVKTGMHPQMFKWKTHHTIDFQLAEIDHELCLLYSCSDGLHKCSELNIDLVENSTMHDLRSHVPCIVECSCHYTGNSTIEARILSSRPDKTTPNYERTVILTLQNIRESISKEELAGVILSGRTTPDAAPVPERRAALE